MSDRGRERLSDPRRNPRPNTVRAANFVFWLGVAIPSLIAFGRLLEIGLKNSFAAFGSSPASPIQTRTDLTLQFTAITLATATTVLFLGLIADRRDRERPAVALVVYTIIGLVCTGLNLFVLWGSKLE